MKSMNILQADGLQIQKKKIQWLFEWASEFERVKAVYVLSLGGKVKDPVVRRQTQCWWLKAGAQASLWLGIQLLFSFHKLISRWIWIISTLRRQNPVCGSLLYSSRPVSLLIIFHLPPPSTHFASLHLLCVCAATHKPTPLLAEECPLVLQFPPVSIKSSLHSAFLIWSPNFFQSLIN